MRLALVKQHPYLPKFIIIDEGFGCMDKIHLKNTCEFFEQLRGKTNEFDWMNIISHIEDLIHITDQHITIQTSTKKPKTSKIEFGNKPDVPDFEKVVQIKKLNLKENPIEPTEEELENDDSIDIVNYDSYKTFNCTICKKEYKTKYATNESLATGMVKHKKTKQHQSKL
jgi:uncharacterized protein YuzB (UPF0349 family)